MTHVASPNHIIEESSSNSDDEPSAKMLARQQTAQRLREQRQGLRKDQGKKDKNNGSKPRRSRHTILFVKNIDPDATVKELKDLFNKFGNVKNVEKLKRKPTQEKGTAYITFSSPKSLEKVLEINKLKKNHFQNKLKVFQGDLLDKTFLDNVFLRLTKINQKIDGVIHFAGLKSVAESVSEPLRYWEANVNGTINLLTMMKKFNCNTLVFSSSAAVYAQSDNAPLSEKSSIKPMNPYGSTKLTIESILKDIFNSSNERPNFASLRYFNPIGAHSSGLIGEDPKVKPNNIFPLIMNTAQGIQKELKIHGNDWPTKDGTPIRDYIHVMDLADAHIKVLENLFHDSSRYINLNIGTGIGTTVLDLVKTFEKVNNVQVPYVFTDRRSGDACYVVADNSLLLNEFEISPRKTIEEMCRDGWKWKTLNPIGF